MTYDPDKHKRRSIRLQGYDYTQKGAYFVTICAFRRDCLFGEIVGSTMFLSTLGCIVEEEWRRTTELRREIELDAYVIMPNHFHAIVWILNDEGVDGRGARPCTPTHASSNDETSQLLRKARSLGSLIAGFKSICTKRINRIRETPGAPVWQRNYYEHIIRDEQSISDIRSYILTNPLSGRKTTIIRCIVANDRLRVLDDNLYENYQY